MPDNTLGSRIQSAWNAFLNKDPTPQQYNPYVVSTGTASRPDRNRMRWGTDKTIVNAIFNRIAVDVSEVQLIHAELDQNGRFKAEAESGLNDCLKVSANRDQSGRAFMIDAVLTMLDEGCVALVPVEADTNITRTKTYDIYELRVGHVIEWQPGKVRLRVFNEDRGKHEDLILPKQSVAIVENPFYSVMNNPNSTLKRLTRKLALLDITDEQNSSGKLDLIIQMPYTIRSNALKKRAEERRAQIETQLAGSKYGIAYADGTEKITQLNRPVENQLQAQVEYLTNQLLTLLGMPEEVLKGTADEKTMVNYRNGVITVILDAFADEMKRKFLTPNARSRGYSIIYFPDTLKMISVNNVADIGDKLTRNQILTSNEVRALLGMKPSEDPNADILSNPNIKQQPGMDPAMQGFDQVDAQLNSMESQLQQSDYLEHYASPYYDPQKAHEYYERTKQLKSGPNTSTSHLNENGKKAAAYVKKQLDEEKSNRFSNDQKKLQSEYNKKISDSSYQTRSKVDALQRQLRNMSRNDRITNKQQYAEDIAKLRQENAKARQEYMAKYSEENANLRNKYNSDYLNKYADELKKMGASPDMVASQRRAATKSKSKSKAKSSNTVAKQNQQISQIGKSSIENAKKQKAALDIKSREQRRREAQQIINKQRQRRGRK